MSQTSTQNAQAVAAEENRQNVRSTWTFSSLTLISRILGFVRLIVMVQLFSSLRWASDALIFAFRIPNLFRNLLGEGALSAAFIPAFVKTERKDGRASAARLGSEIFTILALVSVAVTVVGILVCLAVDHFSGNPEVKLAFRLTALLFPFMPLICIAALLGGMLQSLKRFALPAALPIILNLGFLAGFAYVYWVQCGGDLSRLEAQASTYAVAFFVLAAGVLEVLVLLPALAVNRVGVLPAFSFKHPGVKETLKAFLPVAVGLGLVQINAFFDSVIAGWIALSAPGAVTYLEIAFRFMQLPLGVFGVAIATVSFPSLAAASADADYNRFYGRFIRAIRMSMFLLLPCAAVLIAMADPIVRLTCQRPDLYFSHAAVYRSSAALVLYSAGLLFYSLRQILVRAYYARGEYTFPVKVAGAMVVLNLILNLILIHAPDLYRMQVISYYERWNLSDASFPMGLRLGEAGLALATFLTAIVDVTILALSMRKRLRPLVDADVRKKEFGNLWQTAARMFFASVALGVLTYLFRNSIPYDPGFWNLLIRVAAPCVLAAVSFYIIAIVVPLPEFKEFVGGVFAREKKE